MALKAKPKAKNPANEIILKLSVRDFDFLKAATDQMAAMGNNPLQFNNEPPTTCGIVYGELGLKLKNQFENQ